MSSVPVFDRAYAGTPPVQGGADVGRPVGFRRDLSLHPGSRGYPSLTNIKLAYPPFGLALAFATEGVAPWLTEVYCPREDETAAAHNRLSRTTRPRNQAVGI